MDPVSPNLIAGLAVESIKRLVGRRARTREDQEFRRLNDILTRKVLKRSGSTTVRLMNQLERRVSPAEHLRVGQALRAPEAGQLVRAAAIACLTGEIPQVRTDLQENLAAVLVLVGGIEPDTAGPCAEDVIEVLVQHNLMVIEQIDFEDPRQLSAAVDRAAAEQKAGYLSTIAKRTQVLRRHTPADLREFLHFANRYRAQVHRSNGQLVPAYFDTQKRVNIEGLHILPTFDSPDGVENFDALLRRDLPQHDRVVVLGDPGAGKSTFAQRVVYEHSRGKLGEPDTRVPFVVTVREYEKRRNRRGGSIPTYLAEWIHDQYHLDVPDGAVEYFLATGRAFVVFDGLDELQEVSRRREIVATIESFVALFPVTPILVTSRLVGYREAPLHDPMFREMRIRRFSFGDIATYAHRWFQLDETLTTREQRDVADAFLRESYSIDDVRANPMMLSLLCNVYRGARSIPRNRAELYGRCAQMLFERWDAHRGIDSGGVLKADARGALQDIALWAFRGGQSADRIVERDLRKRLVAYWMEQRLEDRLRAEDAADGLMESWRGRAWVLTDVGIVDSPTGGDQRAYRFTHQTFLEYFAAVELVRRHPSPTKLFNVLEPHLRQSEWDIVAQVAIQLLEDGYRRGKEQILDRILRRAGDESIPFGDRINLLEFAVRNLDTLAPAPKVQRHAARAAAELVIAAQPTFSDVTEFDTGYDGPTPSGPADLDDRARGAAMDVMLNGLLSPGEVGEFFRDEVTQHLASILTSADDVVSAKAFVVGGNLDLLDAGESGLLEIVTAVVAAGRSDNTVQRRWRNWSAITYFAATTALRHGLISSTEFARNAPTAALLLDLPPVIAGLAQPSVAPPVALQWLRRYLGLADPDEGPEGASPDEDLASHGLADTGAALHAAGRHLLRSALPHFGIDWFGSHGFLSTVAKRLRGTDEDDTGLVEIDSAAPLDHDPTQLYGAAVILCAFLERASDVRHLNVLGPFTVLVLGPLQPFEVVFRARFDPSMAAEARRVLYRSPLSPLARQRLASWADRSLDFTS